MAAAAVATFVDTGETPANYGACGDQQYAVAVKFDYEAQRPNGLTLISTRSKQRITVNHIEKISIVSWQSTAGISPSKYDLRLVANVRPTVASFLVPRGSWK